MAHVQEPFMLCSVGIFELHTTYIKVELLDIVYSWFVC